MTTMAPTITLRQATNGSHRAKTNHSHKGSNGNGNSNGSRRDEMCHVCVTLTPPVQNMLSRLEEALGLDRHGVIVHMAAEVANRGVSRDDLRLYARIMNKQFILAQLAEADKLKRRSLRLDNPDFHWQPVRFDWEKEVDLAFQIAARDTYIDDPDDHKTTDFNRSKILSVLITLFAVKHKVARLKLGSMVIKEAPSFVLT